MQFMVNRNKALQVFNTAPSLEVVTYQLRGHAVKLESFDYGLPMGWAKAGQDIRFRVYLDGNPLPPFHGLIWDKFRPAWLPKGITVAAWNDALSHQFKQHDKATL